MVQLSSQNTAMVRGTMLVLGLRLPARILVRMAYEAMRETSTFMASPIAMGARMSLGHGESKVALAATEEG